LVRALARGAKAVAAGFEQTAQKIAGVA